MPKTSKKVVAVKTPAPKKFSVKPVKRVDADKPAIVPKPSEVPGVTNAHAIRQTGGQSKQSILISLLKRDGGATVEEMAKATGWQNHSVLGAISGVLKKRLSLSIDSVKEERGRVYRIAGAR